MAYGSRFCDLFDGVELLLLHSEAKKLGLLLSLVSYKPLVIIFFGQQNRHLFTVWQHWTRGEKQKLSVRRTFEFVLSSRASISCFRAASTAPSKRR